MRALIVTAAALLWACTSNPTPHPGQPDGTLDGYGGRDTATTSADKGPDLDRDGVPDCEQYGGFWDQTDSLCVGGTPSGVDADVVDGDAPDGGDAGDAGEVDGDDAADDEVAADG